MIITDMKGRTYSVPAPRRRRGRGRASWAHLEKRFALAHLQSYLSMSEEEQARDLAVSFPWTFQAWAWDPRPAPMPGLSAWGRARHHVNVPEWLAPRLVKFLDDDDIEGARDLISRLPHKILQGFRESAAANELSSRAESPSYLHMDFVRRLPRKWLAHFSDAASDVACEGFTRGVNRVDELGLTTNFADAYKSFGGYNFAFTVGSAERQGRGRHGRWKYGHSIVLFTAPSVLVHHFGDQEEQAIFWGEDARHIVYVVQDHNDSDKEFCVGEDRWGMPLYCADSLDEIAWWLDHNWRQYKKQLSCGGTQPSDDREHRSGRRGRGHANNA